MSQRVAVVISRNHLIKAVRRMTPNKSARRRRHSVKRSSERMLTHTSEASLDEDRLTEFVVRTQRKGPVSRARTRIASVIATLERWWLDRLAACVDDRPAALRMRFPRLRRRVKERKRLR